MKDFVIELSSSSILMFRKPNKVFAISSNKIKKSQPQRKSEVEPNHVVILFCSSANPS